MKAAASDSQQRLIYSLDPHWCFSQSSVEGSSLCPFYTHQVLRLCSGQPCPCPSQKQLTLILIIAC